MTMRGATVFGGMAGLIVAGMTIVPVFAASPSTGLAAPAAATASVGNEPASTSATYGDWVLRCQRVGEGTAARKACEVAQTIRVPEAREPVAEVALGRLPADKALHVTALLPPNVSFPSAVAIAVDKATSGLELPWRRCLAGGCFADNVATDEMIKTWRGQTAAGRITFKDAIGRDIALPLSFRGLPQALDALDKS